MWTALLLAATLLPAPAPAAIFTVHMSPTGVDTNDGLGAATPVHTLGRVQQILTERKPTTDVEVRIKQGLYAAKPGTVWKHYIPGRTISFLPIDYVYGQGRPAAGLPVFYNPADANGARSPGWWFTAHLPSAADHPLYGGGTTGLRFYYLEVARYNGGLSINGDSRGGYEDPAYNPPLRRKTTAGLNGNTVFGMVFRNIGAKYAGHNWGYGAVLLTNSSDNRITNSHFDYIENSGTSLGLIHGLYVTHFSSNNVISRNDFSYNSSDPVKLRDRSNFNTIEDNEFVRTGRNAHYREEFCDTQCARDNGKARECASYGNRFAYNTLGTGYTGGSMPTWSLSPPGATTAGSPPCSIPAGKVRLHTAGNN